MQGLRDIKGPVEIADHSLLYLLGVLAIVTAVLLMAVYLFKRRKRVRHRFLKTPKELAAERIARIDYDDPKSVAYTFIEDVAHFVDDANRARYEAIVEKLAPYKYKKEVPPLDPKLKEEIKSFIEEYV